MDLSYHMVKEKFGPKIEFLNGHKLKEALTVILKDFLQEINILLVPKIKFSKLGEDGVLIGAAVKILEPLKRRGLMDVK